MKKFAAAASLIIMVSILVTLIPGSVPPCDEYLEWCMYTWCPRHFSNPSDLIACQTQCAVNWLRYCAP